jgi:mannose-6-phosphate isomerase-like protein (cupin superfamily)
MANANPGTGTPSLLDGDARAPLESVTQGIGCDSFNDVAERGLTSSMANGPTFALAGVRIHLADGPRLRSLRIHAASWQRMQRDPALRTGRILGVHAFRNDDDVHASQWERHPRGDELLCLVSGQMNVVLQEPAGERLISLAPLSGVIVPQGRWHRLMVKEPGVLISVTQHAGTQHCDVGDSHRVDVAAQEWQREVFPHSELTPLAAALWVVRGEFPSSQLPRNMIVYRFAGDALLLHSVVALEERAMRQLESFGKPSIMMIPNWDHWAHVVAFKKRYPNLIVLCPRASRARVERRIAVDATCEEYFPRHGIRFALPPGMDPVEGVLELPLDDGRVALVMNDLVTNVPHQPGFRGRLLRITGSSGRPRVIPLVRWRLKINKRVMCGYLEQLASRSDVALLTTSHGECVRARVSEVLAEVARDLGA